MVEIGKSEINIEDLAQRCVEDASKSHPNWPDSCKEFTTNFIKSKSDAKVTAEGKIWNERWDDFTVPGKMDAAWRSKMLKRALKELFPDIVFSVRLDRYSMGNSIDIRWKDGPAKRTVEHTGLKWTFDDVDHDAQGNILSGGNSFVFNERDYSDEKRKWAEDYIKERFGIDDTTLKYDNRYSTEVWRLLQRTDFSKDSPIILEEESNVFGVPIADKDKRYDLSDEQIPEDK